MSEKRRRYLLILLIGTTFLSASAMAASIDFPKAIEFKMTKGSSTSFSIDFKKEGGSYRITMSNFTGLGLTSDQQFWSYVDSKDLSLQRHAVIKPGEKQPIREGRLDSPCMGFDGNKTRCLKYSEADRGEPVQIDIFTQYRAIDLVSSLLVVTHRVAQQDAKYEEESFIFIFNKSTTHVILKKIGTAEVNTLKGKKGSTVLTLTLEGSNTELYQFYIGKDKSGYYPLKMIFKHQSGDFIEFMAADVTW